MTRMTKHVWLYLTATLLALVAGCGAPSPLEEEDTTGSAQLFGTTAQALSSADVTLVRVTVSAADMPARTAELVKSNNQWSGLIGKLPAGTGRTFSAEAFNSSGTRLYAGSATGVTILAKQTTSVSITLQEVNPAAPFANAAPVISSLSAAPGTVEPGGTVTLTASASDTNPGDTLTYAWSAPSGSFAQPSSLSTTWTAPSSAATVPLTLTVTDSKGLQGKVTFNVNVNSGKGDAAVNVSLNTWPQVGNLSASATALEVNESTTVSATASDNDGDTLAYSWAASCAGTWTNATSATAHFTATALPGSSTCNNCNLTVTVTDFRNGQAIGGQTTGTLSICVGPKKTASFPPDITEAFQSATSANGTVIFRVKAVDPQASAMSFSWASTTGSTGTPTTTTDSSEVVWTAPSCTQTGVTPTITATVTNTYGLSSTQSFAVTGLLACGPSGWASAGAMSSARYSFTATQLASGKVLVAGGNNGSGYLSSAELYDPTTNSWSPAGNMATARYQHTATLLSSGKVLIAGGNNPWGLSSAELYDPATNAWSSAGSMAQVHSAHTATLLPSGKVLIAGGDNYQVSSIAAAELYDPATNSWSSAGSMSSAHYGHTATLLPSGKVLIAGGRNGGSSTIAAAQLYDPAANSWSSAGSMTSARLSHTATLLSSGKVLISGGYNGSSALSSAELYDPATNSWSSTASMAAARYSYTATALSSGKVLVSGGHNGSSALSSAELYDPVTNSWSSTASMAAARNGYSTVRLSSGQVLVSGGQNPGTLSSAEFYSP